MDIISAAMRLSQVVIDVDKDWAGHVIKNVGAPVNAADALRLNELNAHKTATPIDHPDASVSLSKLYPGITALIFLV